MRKVIFSIAAVAFMSGLSSAWAQSMPAGPPANAMKLSEIISKIEKRPGFAYVERAIWFSDAYIVTFYTTEKARVEIHFDAVTGQPK